MPKGRRSEWAVLLTLSLGFFMTLLDLTIVNIAIPDMRRGLHASLAEIGWVINAYIIVLAVLMITAGRLGDLRGRKNLFLTGIAVFTLASAASGLSRSATELIAARAVQGLGAALLLPQTMAIIIAIFPGDRRGKALGVWGGVAGLATIAGPTVGGMLVTWLGWRWIFFVNVPVGVIAMLLAVVILPTIRGAHRQRLDLGGVLIASVALVAITFGLVEGQAYGWGSVWRFVSIPLIIGFGLELLAVFVFIQGRRQHRQPLLPFSLFHDRNYALMSAANVIISIGLVGMALPLTIFLQSIMGFSAIKAGLTMAPASLVSGFTAPFAGRLADRGGKYLLICGFLLYATGLAIIVVAARSATQWYDLTPGYLVAGLGIGCTISPMQTIATRNVDPRLAGAASGVMNTFRQTGSVLGSAVVLAVLQNRLAAHAPFVLSMRDAIAVPAGALVLAALLCLGIQRTKVRLGSDKPLLEPIPPGKRRYLAPPSESPLPEGPFAQEPAPAPVPAPPLPPSATSPRVTPKPPFVPAPRAPGVPAGGPGAGEAPPAPAPGAGPVRPHPVPAPGGPMPMPILAAPVFRADEALHVVEVPARARPARPRAPRYVEEPRPGDPLPDEPLPDEPLDTDEFPAGEPGRAQDRPQRLPAMHPAPVYGDVPPGGPAAAGPSFRGEAPAGQRPAKAEAGQAEAAHAGPGHAEPTRPGSAEPGSARPGFAEPGPARPGSARPGSAEPGAAQAGPGVAECPHAARCPWAAQLARAAAASSGAGRYQVPNQGPAKPIL